MNEITNDEVIQIENEKKHEWYGLSTTQREALVLELLNKGYTADQLTDYFDVKTKRVINDFMNGRGYSKRNNTYIPKQQAAYLDAAPVIQNHNNNMLQNINNIQIDEDTIMNILSVSKQSEKIQEIINWYDTNRISDNPTAYADTINTVQAPVESYIEVIDTSLPIPKVDGEIKRTTIRVNENLMKEFNDVWKQNFSEYKQHDLLNLALQMFIDKYK